MDIARFERLIDSLTTPSRRGVLAGLAGGLLAAGPLRTGDEIEAKKNGKRKNKRSKKRKNQNQNQNPSPPPPPDPTVKADATCLGPGEGEASFGVVEGDRRFAQTFTALANGPLVRAELLIVKAAETSGDYILHLGTVDAFGFPTNEVLALASAPSLNVPEGPSTVTFAFANPFSVVAGTQYALILTQPGSDFLRWLGHTGDTCPGRAFNSADQTAPFSAGSNNRVDLDFATFVRS